MSARLGQLAHCRRMNRSVPCAHFVFTVLTGAFIAGCGGGGGGGSKPPPEMHSLGGAVTGLRGTGLVARQQRRRECNVPQGAGTFTFATGVASGTPFNVAVATQPAGPSQTCVVAHGSGTVTGTDVTNVAVTCTDNSFTIGGTVTGLVASGLTLGVGYRRRGHAERLDSSGGPVRFHVPERRSPADCTTRVSVATAPATPPQGCGVAHASGTVGSADVTDVAVGCAPRRSNSLVAFADTVFLFNSSSTPRRARSRCRVGPTFTDSRATVQSDDRSEPALPLRDGRRSGYQHRPE